MSQSDYIQYLKVSTELQSIKKLPPILTVAWAKDLSIITTQFAVN
jgi:hypothetical protein